MESERARLPPQPSTWAWRAQAEARTCLAGSTAARRGCWEEAAWQPAVGGRGRCQLLHCSQLRARLGAGRSQASSLLTTSQNPKAATRPAATAMRASLKGERGARESRPLQPLAYARWHCGAPQELGPPAARAPGLRVVLRQRLQVVCGRDLAPAALQAGHVALAPGHFGPIHTRARCRGRLRPRAVLLHRRVAAQPIRSARVTAPSLW